MARRFHLLEDAADGTCRVDDEGGAKHAVILLPVHRLLSPHPVGLGDGVSLFRQQREWEAVQRDSGVWLPPSLDYRVIAGLSNEMVERLEAIRPETLDQAGRVPGVTPAALSALYVAATRRAAA